MKPREVVLEQVSHHETETLPYTFEFENEISNLLDIYYNDINWRSRIVPYIVRFPAVDTECRIRIDKDHYRDAYGTVWRDDTRAPHIEQPALMKPDLNNYKFPSKESFINECVYNRALEECISHPDSFKVAEVTWGLFERTWTIRGFENSLMDVVLEEDFYEELLDHLVELQLCFIEEAAKLPADAILFTDDWGGQRGILIGPDRWRKLFKARVAKLYQAVHNAGKIVVNHCCGSVYDIIPDLVEIGLDVLQSVQPEAMNPYELKEKWGDKVTFWGGLGSQSIIPFGTPETIRCEINSLCREMGKGGGYILAPSKCLLSDTPVENAAAILEAFNNQEI